jgi:hypothetical protein
MFNSAEGLRLEDLLGLLLSEWFPFGDPKLREADFEKVLKDLLKTLEETGEGGEVVREAPTSVPPREPLPPRGEPPPRTPPPTPLPPAETSDPRFVFAPQEEQPRKEVPRPLLVAKVEPPAHDAPALLSPEKPPESPPGNPEPAESWSWSVPRPLPERKRAEGMGKESTADTPASLPQGKTEEDSTPRTVGPFPETRMDRSVKEREHQPAPERSAVRTPEVPTPPEPPREVPRRTREPVLPVPEEVPKEDDGPVLKNSGEDGEPRPLRRVPAQREEASVRDFITTRETGVTSYGRGPSGRPSPPTPGPERKEPVHTPQPVPQDTPSGPPPQESRSTADGPEEVRRPLLQAKPQTPEVKQISLRIEEASLRFKLQGNTLTVEVRSAQDLQNQITFMESYRLVRSLQSIGVALESLRVNGVEVVPKFLRFPRRERFNIGENEGPSEEVSRSPADISDISLLL